MDVLTDLEIGGGGLVGPGRRRGGPLAVGCLRPLPQGPSVGCVHLARVALAGRLLLFHHHEESGGLSADGQSNPLDPVVGRPGDLFLWGRGFLYGVLPAVEHDRRSETLLVI